MPKLDSMSLCTSYSPRITWIKSVTKGLYDRIREPSTVTWQLMKVHEKTSQGFLLSHFIHLHQCAQGNFHSSKYFERFHFIRPKERIIHHIKMWVGSQNFLHSTIRVTTKPWKKWKINQADNQSCITQAKCLLNQPKKPALIQS